MNLVRLAKQNIPDNRIESLSFFSLVSQGDYIIFKTFKNKEDIFYELTFNPDEYFTFPYHLSYLPVPTEQPLSALIREIHLEVVYAKSNVSEMQELALEPTYIVECTSETMIPSTIHCQISPNRQNDGSYLVGTLNSFGSLLLLKKVPGRIKFDAFDKLCSVTDFLFKSVFPTDKALHLITSFKTFKEFIDTRWITYFEWDSKKGEHILYVATAYNYIVALQWHEDRDELKEYCRVDTEMGRLNYLKVVDDFLLVSSHSGAISLFKIERLEEPLIVRVADLWKKQDRIAVYQSEILYSPQNDAYVIVFSKGIHFLAYRLTNYGEVIDKMHINTNGGKITGLVALDCEQYIVTTITGQALHIQLEVVDHVKFQLTLNNMDIGGLGKHSQILAIATTKNRALFSMIVYRNKEYTQLVKKRQTSASLQVFCLNSADCIKKITTLSSRTLDPFIDYFAILKAIITRSYRSFEIEDFCGFLKEADHLVTDDTSHRLLQIKYALYRIFQQYEKKKFFGVKDDTVAEIVFLKYRLQLNHIFCRLKYLSTLPELSEFQQIVVGMLHKALRCLIKALTEHFDEETDEEHFLKPVLDKFIDTFTCQYANLPFDFINLTKIEEECFLCSEIIGEDSLTCSKNHEVPRCGISFIQIGYFPLRYCSRCNVSFLEEDENLKSLYYSFDRIVCPMCGFYVWKEAFVNCHHTFNVNEIDEGDDNESDEALDNGMEQNDDINNITIKEDIDDIEEDNSNFQEDSKMNFEVFVDNVFSEDVKPMTFSNYGNANEESFSTNDNMNDTDASDYVDID